MSLDFYLYTDEVRATDSGPLIFIRRNGQTVEISREEWDRLYPGREPVTFTPSESRNVFDANITHNLGRMATEAGIYDCLWRPDENGIRVASEMMTLLEIGLDKLKKDPEYFRRFNAPNGWGLYEHFVPFVERILAACKEFPDARVSVSR